MGEVEDAFSQLIGKINSNYNFQEKLPKKNLEEMLSIEPVRVTVWYFVLDLSDPSEVCGLLTLGECS